MWNMNRMKNGNKNSSELDTTVIEKDLGVFKLFISISGSVS